jgi:hypothetical protein
MSAICIVISPYESQIARAEPKACRRSSMHPELSKLTAIAKYWYLGRRAGMKAQTENPDLRGNRFGIGLSYQVRTGNDQCQ